MPKVGSASKELGSQFVSEQELRIALDAAHARLDLAIKALAPKHKGGEWDEFCAANAAVLASERSLATYLGLPHAVPLDFPVEWDLGGGAPLPCLLSNDRDTFLLLRLADSRPRSSSSAVASTGDATAAMIATVQFKRCLSLKMGTPNDEVYAGHPLHGKGLEPYRPLRVINSPWIKELETVNSVHSQYRPEHWKNLHHYIFGFKDSTFECVAQSFVVEKMATTREAALESICARMGLTS
jgi:hypothetical protein